MASSINASLSAGLVQTADTSGIINLQSGGTTVATISSTGAAVTGTLSSTGNTTLGDASTDTLNVGNGDLIKDASGNTGVGISTNTSGAKLFVEGGAGLSIDRTASSNGYRQIYMASGGSSGILQFYNGTNQGSLSVAGAWTNASDARLKKDIVDIKYGLATVNELQPRSYKRVDVDGEHIGFVAQELKQVIPEVVHGDEESQYGVDYGSLVAVAFKAIQELKAIVDTQADQIKALQGAK